MPWSHCDNTVLDDESHCPTCGLTKSEWTVQVGVTRRLVIGTQRRAWVEVALEDGCGGEVADAPYELELPDGRQERGRLDPRGSVRRDKLHPGVCRVRFPGEPPREWWVPPTSWSDGSARPAGTGRAASPAATGWVEVELADDEGRPVAGQAYELRLPDGSLRQGCLDGAGRARVDGVPAGTCQVRFPSWAGSGFAAVSPRAVSAQAPAPTRTPAPAPAPTRTPGLPGPGAPEPRWLELELLDERGEPAGERRFVVELPDGARRSGWLDAAGRARVEGIEGDGPCRVLFPGAGDAGAFDAPGAGDVGEGADPFADPFAAREPLAPARPALDPRHAALREDVRRALAEVESCAGRRRGALREAVRQANAALAAGEPAGPGHTLRHAPAAALSLPEDAPELEALRAALEGADAVDVAALTSRLAPARAAQARREAARDMRLELQLALLAQAERCGGWPALRAALERALAEHGPVIDARAAAADDLEELLGAWVFSVDALANEALSGA